MPALLLTLLEHLEVRWCITPALAGKCQKKVEVEKTDPKKIIRKRQPPGPGLESTRQQKSQTTEEDLETFYR